jgi:hypothetical protein
LEGDVDGFNACNAVIGMRRHFAALSALSSIVSSIGVSPARGSSFKRRGVCRGRRNDVDPNVLRTIVCAS